MTEIWLADLSKIQVLVPEVASSFREEEKIAVNLSLLGELNENLTPLPSSLVSLRRVESVPPLPPDDIDAWRRPLPPGVRSNDVGLAEFVSYALNRSNRRWTVEYLPARVLQQYLGALQLVAFHQLVFRFRKQPGPIVLVGRISEEHDPVIHDFLLAAWTPFANLAFTVGALGITNT